jgi:hypothetical protein
MRLAGVVLLIVGFGLCLSIVWAAIGFMAMSFGLICLLIAEEKNKRARKLAPSGAAQASKTQASKTQAAKTQARDRQTQPSHPVSPPMMSAASAANEGRRLPPEQDPSPEHQAKWKALCTNDPDIAHGAAMLAPYGKKYVDSFARAYLVFNDKDFLPLIVKKMLASAQRDFGLEAVAKPAFQVPDASPIAEPGTPKRQAQPDRGLRIVQRAEPPTPTTAKLAPQPALIAMEKKPVAVSAPPRRKIEDNPPRPSSVMSQMDCFMRDERAVAAAPHAADAAASHATDDLFDELRRLKATAEPTAPSAAAVKHDRGLRAVPGLEAGPTQQRTNAAPAQANENHRPFDGNSFIQQIAQIEKKVRETKPIPAAGENEDASDADDLRYLLAKLG